MKFRLLNRLRAKWGGYFWLPCPLCGQMMGGHEWKDVEGLASSIPDPSYPEGSGRGIGICQDCTRAGKGHYPGHSGPLYPVRLSPGSGVSDE